MKNTTFFLLGSAIVIFFGCEPKRKPDAVVIQPARSVNELFNRTSTVPASASAPVTAGTPATPNSPVQPITPAPPSGATASAEGLNPVHGMPNHRCDIPVGAPLESKTTTKVTTTPKIVTQPQPAPAAPTGSVAAGTNPQHGQPGHDCSIAVGAPLKK